MCLSRLAKKGGRLLQKLPTCSQAARLSSIYLLGEVTTQTLPRLLNKSIYFVDVIVM